ncbi:MAG TPA: hypothetical protein VJ306_13130 [Pyrinomonadaceae bacterium]|nr:hypothetical protein [Pyrinomonadaceae bacterium]
MSSQRPRPPRQSRRLTFRVAGDQIELVKEEQLEMMAPPSVGAPPQEGTHGGYWLEVQDENNQVLDHRLLHFPLGDSVEVFNPDGTIERVFGPATENTFEVLVPDYDDASNVALFGESLNPEASRARRAERAAHPPSAAHPPPAGEPEPPSRELARFKLSKQPN